MTAALSRDTCPDDQDGHDGHTGQDSKPAQDPPVGPTRPALHIVVRPAPRREPPFDDELDAPPAVGVLDQRLPFAKPRPPAHRVAVRQRPRGLPEPTAWGHSLLVGLIETADGHRPLHQLASLLSPSVGRGLGADFERAAQSGAAHWLHSASVRTLRASEPVEGVAELCATLDTGRRVRAVAIRIEERHGRWRCTRLQLG